MEENRKMAYKVRLTPKQLFSVPNILSYIRIALIPLIVWLYVGKQNYSGAFIVILISSFTDIADGFIARHFNMITDFGKMIDPVADKLTQLAIIVCLVTRFPLMLLPLCIMPVKEIASFIMRLRLFQKHEEIYGALWHGKLNTVLLYIVICSHIVFPNFMSGMLSTVSILISSAFMIFSFVMYTVSCVNYFKEAEKRNKN